MASKNKRKTSTNYSKTTKHQEANDFLVLFMFFMPFFLGLSRAFLSLGATIIIVGVMIFTLREKGYLFIKPDVSSVSGFVIAVCAFVTIFTGVSKGNSFIGFVQILAILVFYIFAMQNTADERENGLSLIPDSGVVMVVLSALIYIIPDIRHLISASGRLSGFFGYANTFALFLLLGIIIFSLDTHVRRRRWQQIAYPIVLMAGILWSGSRTTIIMTFVVLFVFSIRNKEQRKIFIPILAAVVAMILVVGVVMGATDSFARVLTLSQSSTLLGRFLYWKDALRQVPNYPLGQGYLGYFLSHEALSHGVYTVRFVHNEWIQVLVDYGVVAFIAFIVMIISQLYRIIKKKSELRIWIFVVTLIHMIMDMDLQFMVIVWILILCFEFPNDSKNDCSKGIGKKLFILYPMLTALAVLFVWIGASDLLFATGKTAISDKLFPWNAEVKDRLLVEATEGDGEYDINVVKKIALDASGLYEYDSTAYDTLSICAYYDKDYIGSLEYKYRAVLLQPYRTEEYKDFMQLADECRSNYSKNNSKDSKANIGRIDELVDNVKNRIKEVEENTDPLAYRINDKPDLSGL